MGVQLVGFLASEAGRPMSATHGKTDNNQGSGQGVRMCGQAGANQHRLA